MINRRLFLTLGESGHWSEVSVMYSDQQTFVFNTWWKWVLIWGVSNVHRLTDVLTLGTARAIKNFFKAAYLYKMKNHLLRNCVCKINSRVSLYYFEMPLLLRCSLCTPISCLFVVFILYLRYSGFTLVSLILYYTQMHCIPWSLSFLYLDTLHILVSFISVLRHIVYLGLFCT